MYEEQPNKLGPNRAKGGVAGPRDRAAGKHPLQPSNQRGKRPNDGTENDDNTRAEKPVAE